MPNASVPVVTPGLPSSRRAFVLGLGTLPIARTALAVPLPDPHIALAEEAVALWRQSKAKAWGWNCPSASPEAEAATQAHSAMTDRCFAVSALPPPRTLPGLSALAVAVALSCEEMWHENHDKMEGTILHLLECVLSFTGAVMPEGYAGLVYRFPANMGEEGVR